MRKVVFDIETSNLIFDRDLSKMELSVVCIHDSETDDYSCYLQEDLPKLWPILEKTDLLIGYNSNHFDIPILDRYYPGDLTKIKSIDLLKEIKDSLGRRLKLDGVAQATLGIGKTADGSKAVEWWHQGEHQKVIDYCKADVKVTKELYDFALTNGYVKFKDFSAIKEIKLDTAQWETKEDAAMTHTLPF